MELGMQKDETVGGYILRLEKAIKEYEDILERRDDQIESLEYDLDAMKSTDPRHVEDTKIEEALFDFCESLVGDFGYVRFCELLDYTRQKLAKYYVIAY